jgi:rare lipoprotein A
MQEISDLGRLSVSLMAWIVGASVAGFTPDVCAETGATVPESAASRQATSEDKPTPDRSGRKRVGKASFYADTFAGRKMADGTTMDPHGDNAASKTLPLGTRAKVTNLETGQSAVVTIRDRGPYVTGRIVDLSPSTARKIGITRDSGVAKVEVVPIAVPMPDGSVKLGAAARDAKTVRRTSGDWSK